MNQIAPPPKAGQETGRLPFLLRLRYGLETVGFFLVIGFFRLFGIDRASAIGGWIGRTLVARTSLSRRASENLRAAFPEKSEAEISVILRDMWDNLGRVMAEYAHLDEIHATGPNPRIAFTGLENLAAARARGKGILLVSGHFANWEVTPIGGRDVGITGAVVFRPTNNPHVNRWIMDVRARTGMAELIPKGPQGTKRVFTLLRKGECVSVVADQRTSEGILVPFFGREALTTPVPAALALKLGASILPVSNVRVNGAHFRTHIHPMLEPPDTGDAGRDVLEFTTAINAFLEACVREHPAQWLWIHKRWVRKDAPLRKRAQALSPGRGGASNATSKRV